LFVQKILADCLFQWSNLHLHGWTGEGWTEIGIFPYDSGPRPVELVGLVDLRVVAVVKLELYFVCLVLQSFICSFCPFCCNLLLLLRIIGINIVLTQTVPAGWPRIQQDAILHLFDLRVLLPPFDTSDMPPSSQRYAPGYFNPLETSR
jgi:hypothetical protein